MKKLLIIFSLFFSGCSLVSDADNLGLGLGYGQNLDCWMKQRSLRKLVEQKPELLDKPEVVKAFLCEQ